MRPSSCWASLAVVLTVAGQVAAADPEPPAQHDAQTRFEEGLERVRAGDYEAARISFQQAYAVIKRPSVLWNLALAEEKTGHLVDALAHFKRLVGEPALAGADREDARRHATALRGQTGHIEIQAPAGAVLRIDADTSAGVAPLTDAVDVVPGHHVVQARVSDASQSSAVDVGAGQVVKVGFGVPGSPSGQLPGGQLPSDAADGHRGDAQAAGPSNAFAGEAPNVPPGSNPAPQFWRPQTVTAVALGGAAVAAAAFGLYFAVASHDEASDAATLGRQLGTTTCHDVASAACSHWRDVVRSQNRDATASDVLYVTAGALAVGAVAAVLLWPHPSGTGSAWLAPAVGAGAAGVSGGGTF